MIRNFKLRETPLGGLLNLFTDITQVRQRNLDLIFPFVKNANKNLKTNQLKEYVEVEQKGPNTNWTNYTRNCRIRAFPKCFL